MKTFKGEGISHRLGVCPLCHAEIFVEIETGVACEVIDRSILSTTGSVVIPGPAHVHPETVGELTGEDKIREMLNLGPDEPITCTSGDNVMTAAGYVSIDTATFCQGCDECDPAPAAPQRWTLGFDLNGYSERC